MPGPTEADRYATLPLPPAWKPVLDALKPVPDTLPAARTFDVTPLFCQLTAPLTQKSTELLIQRLGHHQTLNQVASSWGVSHQRVQQVQQHAMNTVRHHGAQQLRTLITDLCAAEQQSSELAAFSFTASGTPGFQDGDGDALWMTLLELHRQVEQHEGDCQPRPDGGWLLSRHSLDLHAARRLLIRERRFMEAGALAEQSGASQAALRGAAHLRTDLFLTRSGNVGLKNWNQTEWITALARELDRHGHPDFHYSEIAQALQEVCPERFVLYAGVKVLQVLRTTARPLFENTGRNGRYTLREYGDGHRNNREAVLAVLQDSSEALTLKEIHARLKRDLTIDTLKALLRRETAFAHGAGRWIAAETTTPTPGPEGAFLSALFADSPEGVLLEGVVDRAAQAAGLDPQRVAEYARTSTDHLYYRSKGAYALADSRTALLWKFENWYQNRSIYRNRPPQVVLQAGLDDDRARGRHRRTDAIRAYYEQRGWDVQEPGVKCSPG